MNLLSAHNLSLSIGGKEVCHKLSFSLAAGQTIAILGQNGAGKSTLLAALAGLLNAAQQSGEILLCGESYITQTPASAAKRRGWLGQQSVDAFASTVLETVLTGRHPHLGRWDWESPADHAIAQAALTEVGLADFAMRRVHTLSSGERQRLNVATLLTQAPSLYLLDEPLSHLDLNHQIALLNLFKRRAQAGAGVIMVLHEPELAWRFADKVILLFPNETIIGDCHATLSAPNLSKLYNYPLHAVDVAAPSGTQRCFIPQ